MNQPIPAITGFAAIGVMVLVALFFALFFIGVSMLLGPKKPSDPKLMPYESGMTPVGDTKQQFGIHFYLVAMLFIIFDIEAIFLFPWAVLMPPARAGGEVAMTLSPVFLLGEMAVFMTILFVGYIYVVKKGALEWE